MYRFRIAHLSDLHFSDLANFHNPVPTSGRALWALQRLFGEGTLAFYPSTYSPERAHLLAEYIHPRLEQFDAVLVSGDLATTGEVPDLRAARDYLLGTLPLMGVLPSCAVVDDQTSYLSVPGNHDQYSGASLIPGGRGNFERFFGRGWDLDRGWANLLFQSPSGALRLFGLAEEQDDGELGEGLAIVCVDLALQLQSHAIGGFGYLGQGRAYPEVITDLLAVSEMLADANKDRGAIPTIWVVHFPPDFPVSNGELDLLDHQELVAAARACGIRYILAGHRHVQRIYQVDGGAVVVICAGSATSVDVDDTGNSFLDVEVRVGAGLLESVGCSVVQYDLRQRAFRASSWEDC